MNKGKIAQVSVELVIMASIALSILLVIYLSNNMISSSWENQRQKTMASFAADSLALEIGRAVSGGDGTTVHYFNKAGQDIAGMSLTYNRSIQVTTVSGLVYSAPLVTSNISAPGGLPLNTTLRISNSNGRITIEGT